MEYFPFGETFIEERTDAEYTSYLFNGKELDEETGLYYYGARYYDPRISMFYGVDPLAEKHSELSPFLYVLNNPLRYIDPDGRTEKERKEALKAAQNLIGVKYEAEIPQNERVKTGQLDCSGLVRFAIMQNPTIEDPFEGKTGNGVSRIMESSISVDKDDIVDGDMVVIKSGGNENGHIGFVKDVKRNDDGKVVGYTMLHSEAYWENGEFNGGGDINETKINVGGNRGYSRDKYNHRFFKWDTQEGPQIDEVKVLGEGEVFLEPITDIDFTL